MDSSTDLQISEMWFKDLRCRGFPAVSFIFPRKSHNTSEKKNAPSNLKTNKDCWFSLPLSLTVTTTRMKNRVMFFSDRTERKKSEIIKEREDKNGIRKIRKLLSQSRQPTKRTEAGGALYKAMKGASCVTRVTFL